jgi:hypothetical protein
MFILIFYSSKVANNKVLIPVIWNKKSSLYPAFSTSKCRLSLGCQNIQSDKGPTGDHKYGDLPQTPNRGMTR